jgi:(4-(4-[2-(gamma-L-glutamylamino)ethyl]phenoxymethyl)furan-2-yl)methanamine synthase
MGDCVSRIIGWDIGGVNVKATWLETGDGTDHDATRTVSEPFEIWRAKDDLLGVLQAARAAVATQPSQAMALTMTAELSDVFETKREGVLFVLDSMAAAFPDCPVYALSLAGTWLPLAAARQQPLDFAAANWLATALWLARRYPDCLLIDCGSTTTDIIPILHGRVAATGRTDLARLLAGELVYTGALRTNVAAITAMVPITGRECPVASEYFAISADVHLILGRLAASDYTCPAPDGRPATPAAARGRLARVVCADSEQLCPDEIVTIAQFVADRQVTQIAERLTQVLARLGGRRDLPVVTLGLGAFLAADAARQMGLKVHDLARDWGRDASVVAPSWAAAHLLAAYLDEETNGRGEI